LRGDEAGRARRAAAIVVEKLTTEDILRDRIVVRGRVRCRRGGRYQTQKARWLVSSAQPRASHQTFIIRDHPHLEAQSFPRLQAGFQAAKLRKWETLTSDSFLVPAQMPKKENLRGVPLSAGLFGDE